MDEENGRDHRDSSRRCHISEGRSPCSAGIEPWQWARPLCIAVDVASPSRGEARLDAAGKLKCRSALIDGEVNQARRIAK